ncbi:MAG: selenide, water dikinase SelD [Candidatus Eremiobacteraeota bacterium]|nr:selenide, water dikinase SelD [Candidatus Eremiobacteraeota bacterium]
MASIRLTELSSCAGCAAKLGAAELRRVMERVSPATNDRVLVGYGSSDDAGVYLLRDDLALVQTVDFFPPIVDDPYDFGRIAATNAFSDVYAMGGRPLTALNIVAFPEALDLAILSQILEGGATVALSAGVAIVGGHTIKDDEPKYGMAVSGVVDPKRIVTNAGARPGDMLVLTKPLGTGILTTARKRGAIGDEDLSEAVRWMTTLNDRACEAMLAADAHAATDITGFGLLGHADNMARASGVRLSFEASAVPFMSGVIELIEAGMVPGGTRHNAETHAAFTTFAPSVPHAARVGLSDAQTSGGLLISVSPERLDQLTFKLKESGALAAVVGEVREGAGIEVRWGVEYTA